MNAFNSLATGRCGSNFKSIFKFTIQNSSLGSQANATEHIWWYVSIGLRIDWVSSGIKPLPELMLTQLHFAIWRPSATMSKTTLFMVTLFMLLCVPKFLNIGLGRLFDDIAEIIDIQSENWTKANWKHKGPACFATLYTFFPWLFIYCKFRLCSYQPRRTQSFGNWRRFNCRHRTVGDVEYWLFVSLPYQAVKRSNDEKSSQHICWKKAFKYTYPCNIRAW